MRFMNYMKNINKTICITLYCDREYEKNIYNVVTNQFIILI
jgi:hypothetical protein